MSQVVTYSLLAVGSVALLCVTLLAAWRRIPRPDPPPDVQALWAEVQALRTVVLDLGDKYETAVQRDRGRRRGKKDRDDEEPAPPAIVTPLDRKTELRVQAIKQGLVRG